MPAEEPSLPEPLASSAAAFEAALPLWWMASSSTLRFLSVHRTLMIHTMLLHLPYTAILLRQ